MELVDPLNAAAAFSTSISEVSISEATSVTDTCMRVPGRGGPRMSRSGFLSMIDSDCAHPTADRRTRNRPETTETVAPDSRHLAIATRTTSGRRVETRRFAMGSPVSALAFERAELHVEGRQSC
jgi:hypothetical protein